MSLAFGDRLKLLVPAALYDRCKIAKESRRHEPELSLLRDFVPSRGTARGRRWDAHRRANDVRTSNVLFAPR